MYYIGKSRLFSSHKHQGAKATKDGQTGESKLTSDAYSSESRLASDAYISESRLLSDAHTVLSEMETCAQVAKVKHLYVRMQLPRTYTVGTLEQYFNRYNSVCATE